MSSILVVIGATAVGKTQWLLSHFSNPNYAVINIDSVQVYKHFNIGTAKVTRQEQSQLSHFMVDERDPLEPLSINEYIEKALESLEFLLSQGKKVIISGGTPYYLKHLLWGSPSVPPVDLSVRQEVSQRIQLEGIDNIYNSLKVIDPIFVERVPKGDLYRISRAWEVYIQTGKAISSFNDRKEGGIASQVNILGLERSRPLLWERAYQRVQKMKKEGLKEEVINLIKQGYSDAPAMHSIGYKEWLAPPSCESDDYIWDSIYIHTRQYIKRQTTFFHSFPEVAWFDLENPDNLEKFLEGLSF